MANLNEKQERLLANVGRVLEQVTPNLNRLREDFDAADYRAKAPVRDAISAALEADVPFSRIVKDGMGFSYPAKLKDWLRPPGGLFAGAPVPAAEPVSTRQTAEQFSDAVDAVKTVTRDADTGEIKVHYLGMEYVVKSLGTSKEFWSSADPAIPQGVYDLIQREFPAWELLEDEEDD